MNARAARAFVLAVGLAALAACSGDPEPDDAALREAIQRMHTEWSGAERRNTPPAEVPEFYRRMPNVNLSYEARFALQSVSVRKILCRPAGPNISGFNCRAVVSASMAGRQPILQNIEGRFFKNTAGWQVRDLTVAAPPTG